MRVAGSGTSLAGRGKWAPGPRWLDAVVLLLGLVMIFCPLEGKAAKFEETVFRTGVQGESDAYSISPDGSRVLFTISSDLNTLWLLDLKSGRVSKIPEKEGSTWEMPAWSRDGKRVAAISTALRDGEYQVGKQEVILIDPRDWSHRKLAATPGVNVLPFFSADGRTVYYFKGKKRKSGKTSAANYDLYAYDLAENRETRLTHKEMYQVGQGYDDGDEILFSADSFFGKTKRDLFGWKVKVPENGLYAFGKVSQQLRPIIVIDKTSIFASSSDGFVLVTFGDKDAAGNVYLKVAKNRPGGGNYLWFVYRCDARGKNCVGVREITINGDVRTVPGSGEIFIDAVEKGEIVFRRLVEKPEGQ